MNDESSIAVSDSDFLEAQEFPGLLSDSFICYWIVGILLQALERQIAEFHGREDAILYASCFDANAGLFEVLMTPDDAILSDELNHASIIDGIRLCKAKKYRYKHKDMKGILLIS